MRTTLMINDELVAAAKRLAVERGCSLSSVVNDALRLVLKAQSHPNSSREFRMLCYRGQGNLIDTPPARMSELDQSADLESLSDR